MPSCYSERARILIKDENIQELEESSYENHADKLIKAF